MNTPNDGGPAFPAHDLIEGICNESFHGMTLRDYFAAKAMQGFCGNPAAFAHNERCGWKLVNIREHELAEYCYFLADALLSERTKQGK